MMIDRKFLDTHVTLKSNSMNAVHAFHKTLVLLGFRQEYKGNLVHLYTRHTKILKAIQLTIKYESTLVFT